MDNITDPTLLKEADFLKKQKELLLVLLESLHKDEAEILVKLLQKKLNIKFLTPSIVKEAYPGINV